MNTDYQSHTVFLSFSSQVIGFDPDFLAELFLYLSAKALATADPWRSVQSVVKIDWFNCRN